MNYLLMVDDNAVDRELVRGLLEKRPGFRVRSASNGIEALEQVEAATPLAVITDLEMPEMDGLSLVKAVRRRFPTVPVLVMTAFGNEEIAVEALVEGAADYVSKDRLGSELVHAVEGILSLASGEQRHEQITQYLQYKQLRYELPNNLALIPPMVDQLQQAVTAVRLVDAADRLRFARCLAEALRNAVFHGNLKSGADSETARQSSVNVCVELSRDEARFTIRDQGKGFDHSRMADPRQSPECLHAKGKGLNLLRLFMDEVQLNECGNELTLVKRRTTALVAQAAG
jgi:DNA-binding response OmpR family regulator/anti-sigma regulatory factor (Ser/Thr protein kinase)